MSSRLPLRRVLNAHVYAAQGILNYNGKNTLAVSLWATDAEGARVDSLKLVLRQKVETSFGPVVNAPAPGWTRRPNVY